MSCTNLESYIGARVCVSRCDVLSGNFASLHDAHDTIVYVTHVDNNKLIGICACRCETYYAIVSFKLCDLHPFQEYDTDKLMKNIEFWRDKSDKHQCDLCEYCWISGKKSDLFVKHK